MGNSHHRILLYLFIFIWRQQNERIKALRKNKQITILIVKTGALGDVLRTTALLLPLSCAYRARISWLTSKEAKPLLAGNPLIEKIFTAPKQITQKFDWTLSLEEDKALAKIAQESFSKKITGVIVKDGQLSYTDDSAPYYQMSLLNPNRALANQLKSQNQKTFFELWLSILGLSRFKKSEFMRPQIFLTESERKTALNFARKRFLLDGAIGFNPGAGIRWPSKELSIEKSREVIKKLASFKKPILLLGGLEEKKRNRAISRGLKGVILPPPMPLKSFAALMDFCTILITTDSLAFHIATALKKKVLVLIGPTSSSELDVFGKGEKIIARPCDCFYRPHCSREKSCLNAISESRVFSAVKRFL